MGAFITPKGTTVGQGWEYQIIQGSAATNWTPWSESLEFSTDPATNQPFQPGKLYWLVARNPDITLGLPGSITRPVAAGLEVTDSGRVQPASPDGLLATVQTLSDLLSSATPDQLDSLLGAMLGAIKAPTLDKFCELVASCTVEPSTFEWIIDQQYEEVDGEDNLTVVLSNTDFRADSAGIFRIAGPTTVLEGTAAQYSVEEQLTDDSWVAYTGSLIWSTVSAPAGVSINSLTGYLIVGANSLSADVTIAIHAAIPGSLVELPVLLANTTATVSGYHISGPSTLTEGSTSGDYYVIIDFADSSTLIYIGDGDYSVDSSPAYLSINGGDYATINLTAAPNAVSANTPVTLRFTFPDTSTITKTVTVQDTPCTSHPMLTQSQFDALPEIVTYEYADPSTPYGGLPYTIRAFASRSEAITQVPTYTQLGSHCNYDRNKVSTSAASVGDVLYNDNRPEHFLASTSIYYPVEAGFWGFDLRPESFVLLQTNACGEIISRELIPIPAE